MTYLDAMADGSGIEWTEATWNPTTGCDESAPAATTPSGGWRPAAFAITGTAQVLVLCVRWSPLRTLGLYVLRGLAAVALPGP